MSCSTALRRSGQAQRGKVRICTGHGTGLRVGADDFLDPAPGQDRGEHAGAGADVEGAIGAGQLGARHQVQVLPAHRGEGAVVRMDLGIQGGDVQPGGAPLLGADGSEQFLQGHHRGSSTGAEGVDPGLGDVRGATQRDHRARVHRDQQHGQHPGALRARLAVLVEALGRRRSRGCLALGLGSVGDPAGHGARAAGGRCGNPR